LFESLRCPFGGAKQLTPRRLSSAADTPKHKKKPNANHRKHKSPTMPPKFDPSEVIEVFVRVTGGEIGAAR